MAHSVEEDESAAPVVVDILRPATVMAYSAGMAQAVEELWLGGIGSRGRHGRILDGVGVLGPTQFPAPSVAGLCRWLQSSHLSLGEDPARRGVGKDFSLNHRRAIHDGADLAVTGRGGRHAADDEGRRLLQLLADVEVAEPVPIVAR